MKVLEQPILLASQSPRRRQLLTQAGFEFTVRPVDVEETFPEEMDKRQVAAFLAEKKALAAQQRFGAQEFILAADSIVLLNDTIYGKPADAAEAMEILSALSGQIHEVITGVCLLWGAQKRIFSGLSRVHVGVLTEEEIAFYVQQYQPFDKAGAYAIQEWIGLCKIHKIEGTYANIMGLPVDLVYQEMQSFLKERV